MNTTIQDTKYTENGHAISEIESYLTGLGFIPLPTETNGLHARLSKTNYDVDVFIASNGLLFVDCTLRVLSIPDKLIRGLRCNDAADIAFFMERVDLERFS
jgi:hypothetical protein